MKNSVTICIWIIGILFILCFCECGARKVQKSESKEETKSEIIDNSIAEKQIDTNIKKTVETKIDDKNETVTKKTTYEPQDVTKEASITEPDGKKTVLNNTKKIVEETVQKNNTQNSVSSKTEHTQKESEKEQKAIEQKQEVKKEESKKVVDKKQFNPINYYIGFVIFIIILVIAYFVFKRLKVI